MKPSNFSMRIFLLLLLFSLVILLYFHTAHQKFRIRIFVEENHIINSNFDFFHEHWKEKRLARLRSQESFPKEPRGDQFSHFMELTNWVHHQWDWSPPDPYPLSNALDILADIRQGRTGGFCGQYAYVLADVLKSVGYFSVRYLELWSNSGRSHFSVEVWSDQFRKWIVLDPDQAIFFELGNTGVPANALEIRESLLDPTFEIFERPVDPSTPMQQRVPRDVYANFAVSLRSDLMRHTRPLTVEDRFDMFLFYRDHRTEVSAFRDFGDRIPYRLITTRVQDIYYDCNRVRIAHTLNPKAGRVELEFFTDGSMPNFFGFIVSNNQGKTWSLTGQEYAIQEPPGGHVELWIAPINVTGRIGVISIVNIDFR